MKVTWTARIIATALLLSASSVAFCQSPAVAPFLAPETTSGYERKSTPPSTSRGVSDFRQGKIARAEEELRDVVEKEPWNVRAAVALARIYRSMSLHARAFLLLKKAHRDAPNDVEVEREWLAVLPLQERTKELDRFLSEAKQDDAELNNWFLGMRDFLSSLQNFPKHGCELVRRVESAEEPLVPLLYDATHLRGWGLEVAVNGRKMRLLLDTGASGIVISRNHAKKAGVVDISPAVSSGIGSRPEAHGYTAYAQSVRVGGLEFRDCVVQVIEGRDVVDGDGLIGTDVFRKYLVDIDYPGRKLKLAPLPERTDAAVSSDADVDAVPDENETGLLNASIGDPGHQDRYVAPEMREWSAVYRFGHLLLIGTRVNGSPPELFAIDTGAGRTMIATEFAKQVTRLNRGPAFVEGLTGLVNEVYWTDGVTLDFSDMQRTKEECVSFDLAPISKHVGTKVSGILGLSTLKSMEIKINYRDGLVDFVYDPKRVPLEGWLK